MLPVPQEQQLATKLNFRPTGGMTVPGRGQQLDKKIQLGQPLARGMNIKYSFKLIAIIHMLQAAGVELVPVVIFDP
jgi:hypothetical protein